MYNSCFSENLANVFSAVVLIISLMALNSTWVAVVGKVGWWCRSKMFENQVRPINQRLPNLLSRLCLLDSASLERTFTLWIHDSRPFFSTNILLFLCSLNQSETTVLFVRSVTDVMFKSVRAALVFVARFAAICVVISTNLVIDVSFFDNLDLFTTKLW